MKEVYLGQDFLFSVDGGVTDLLTEGVEIVRLLGSRIFWDRGPINADGTDGVANDEDVRTGFLSTSIYRSILVKDSTNNSILYLLNDNKQIVKTIHCAGGAIECKFSPGISFFRIARIGKTVKAANADDSFVVIVAKNVSNEKAHKNIIEKSIETRLSYFYDSSLSGSQIIDKCLDYVKGFGSRVIHFDLPSIVIDKAICVPSNTKILLENCSITQADETHDNVFRSANVSLPEYPSTLAEYAYIPSRIEWVENIEIIGDGNSSISAPAVYRQYNGADMTGDSWGSRQHLVNFTFVKGGKISGFSTLKSHAYTIGLEYCENVEVGNLDITTACPNGDGIHVMSGCRHIYIHDVHGVTTDDLIAINSAHTDKDDARYNAPKKFSYYAEREYTFEDRTLGDEFDIVVNNIHKEGRRDHLFLLFAQSGYNIHDVYVKNARISGTNTGSGIYNGPGWLGTYCYLPNTATEKSISNIRYENPTSEVDQDYALINDSYLLNDVIIVNPVVVQGRPLINGDLGNIEVVSFYQGV